MSFFVFYPTLPSVINNAHKSTQQVDVLVSHLLFIVINENDRTVMWKTVKNNM